MLSPQSEEFQANPRFERARATLDRLIQLCSVDENIDVAAVQDAVDLMVRAHLKQANRPDGQPYVSHPAQVALIAYERFGVRSTEGIIAALLHDVVEDQPERVIDLLGGVREVDDVKAEALRLIGERFGERVAYINKLLTIPDLKELAVKAQLAGDPREIEPIKNEIYREHFLEILKQDSEAFLIKLADFSENALSLSNLDGKRKNDKLRAKYKPVIEVVIEKIELTPDEGTPLSVLKKDFLGELREVYQKDYRDRV